MITFLINRARRHWQVLSTVFLGVLISTVILASGPIIVDTVINFALPNKLRSSFEDNGVIFLSTYNNKGELEHKNIHSIIHESLSTNISELKYVINSSASSWMYPWQEGTIISDERLNFRSFAGIEDRINFIAGGWPEKPDLDSTIIRAVVPESMSEAYVIGVGDILPVSKNNNDPNPSHYLEITGIYNRRDASDPYWLIESNPFEQQNNSRYVAEFGVLIRDKDYYTITEELFPNSNHLLKWMGIIDPGKIDSTNLQGVVDGIENIRTSLTSFDRKVVLKTNLDEFLNAYKSQSSEIIPPLYLLIGEVLFLGLYYVVMVAALSIRQVEGELSILASRGAEIGQLLRIQIFDALIVCIMALIFGPLMSYGIVNSLTSIGPLSDINQIDWITRIPSTSWIAAGVSVLACFTALIIPTLPILRRSVVQHHQSLTRRNNVPWWHRYYLDVLLLIIGLIALWRLNMYGSISGLHQGKVDWMLLFAPLALLIGSATVLLRLFPAIFRVIAIGCSTRQGFDCCNSNVEYFT